MKVWRITIGTEDGGGNIDSIVGVAATAQEAIDKAIAWAKKPSEYDPENTGYENPYPSKVEDLGEQEF